MIDAVALACLAAEFGQLVDERITGASQPADTDLELELGRKKVLFLSCHPQWGRIHTIDGRLARSEDTHLVNLLSHHVVGGQIKAVSATPWERILTLTIVKPDLIRTVRVVRVVVELMGKHGNIIIVGEDGLVLDSVKRIGRQHSRVRPMYPGIAYRPPPSRPGVCPGAEVPRERSSLPIGRYLIQAVQGMSPLWATELCYRAGVDERTPTADVDDRAWQAVSEELVRMADLAVPGRFSPTGYEDERGQLIACWAYPLHSMTEGRPVSRPLDELVRALFHHRALDDAIGQRKRQVQSELNREIAFRQRTLDAPDHLTGDPELLQRHGELVLAWAHAIPAGSDHVSLPDFDDPSVTHDIALVPDLSPIDNAKTLFDKARRAISAKRIREHERKAAQQQLERLLRCRERLERTDSLAEVEQIREELADLGIGGPQRRSALGHRPQYLHLKSPGGLDILVGRNDRQNDYLTFSLASDHDLWLHARNVPGAHVIVKLPSFSSRPDERCLQFVAGIAAYFSSRQDDTAVEVDYTRRKYVRRRKGAGAGQVLYENFQTIIVRPLPPPDHSLGERRR